MASYMDNIREIVSRVNMSFYSNSGEDFGEVYINRTGWTYDASAEEVTAPSGDWMFAKRNQIVTYGMETEKYAALDGSTKLDGTFTLVSTALSGITGLASDKWCGADGTFTDKPVLRQYYTLSRDMSQVIIVGHRALGQYPVEYDVVVHYLTVSDAPSLGSDIAPAGSQTHNVSGVKSESGGEKVLTFSVTGGACVEQIVSFRDESGKDMTAELYCIELVIKKWNSGGKIAKITYFSRDVNMNITADEILSISVLEEKTTDVNKLTYGISSNSCTVKVKDTNKRFSSNPDLLKKNKLVQPFIAICDHDGDNKPVVPADNDYEPLGRFYSDSWEMDSDSAFVTCKAYDILYGLQEIYVDIPYAKNAEGKYAAPENVSVYDVIERIVRFSNEYKQNNEIYGMNIDCVIDEDLKNAIIPVVLYDNTKSVWDTLQAVANFAQCYIYADRKGRLVATCDIPYTSSALAATVTEDAYISPKNSFSYSIPLQSKCIVNRVIMPYSELKLQEDKNSDVITVKKEDLKKITDDSGTRYAFSVELDNLHLVYEKFGIKAPVNGLPINLDNNYIYTTKLYYNSVYLELIGIDEGDVEIKINQDEEANDRYKLEDYELTEDSSDRVSVRINGQSEYSADKSQFMVARSGGAAIATSAAKRILGKYENGVEYAETEWIGSPKLALCGHINCRSKYDAEPHMYECFSNEFTLDEGLRVNSKLRKA